jgi:hypothetical protein
LKAEGADNFDVSFSKSFETGDAGRLKFTAEIFNLFNHPQFALPNFNLSSPGFGEVTNQVNLPRTVQFALRYTF